MLCSNYELYGKKIEYELDKLGNYLLKPLKRQDEYNIITRSEASQVLNERYDTRHNDGKWVYRVKKNKYIAGIDCHTVNLEYFLEIQNVNQYIKNVLQMINYISKKTRRKIVDIVSKCSNKNKTTIRMSIGKQSFYDSKQKRTTLNNTQVDIYNCIVANRLFEVIVKEYEEILEDI